MDIERRIVAREWRLVMARPGDILKPMWFLLVVISLIPLALSPESSLLAEIGPALIWVATLLAILLNMDALFRDDFIDGVLEQWIFWPRPFAWCLAIKLLMHWLFQIVPLILITPVVGLMLSIEVHVIGVLLVTLLVATPALTCFSGLGGALTLGAARSSVLGVLVMLPLFVPVVILAAGIIMRATDGAAVGPLMALLAAFSLAAGLLVPIAIAAAIRLNIGGST